MLINKEKPFIFDKKNLIIVEGKDEVLFLNAFAKHLGLKNILFLDIGGKTTLKDNLETLPEIQGYEHVVSLGVVRDADNDPQNAFESVCGALKSNHYTVPDKPAVLIGNKPKIAVLILPGENKPGMLEDVCLEALKNDPAIACVDDYFQCLKNNGIEPPQNMSKARIHAFLASRPKPDLRLGESAGKESYWNYDDPAFDTIQRFLQLFP